MIPDFITDNPALWTSFVAAALTLGVAFGLHLTTDQFNAILGLDGAILALGVVAHKTSVPKTPSLGASDAKIQDRPA